MRRAFRARVGSTRRCDRPGRSRAIGAVRHDVRMHPQARAGRESGYPLAARLHLRGSQAKGTTSHVRTYTDSRVPLSLKKCTSEKPRARVTVALVPAFPRLFGHYELLE